MCSKAARRAAVAAAVLVAGSFASSVAEAAAQEMVAAGQVGRRSAGDTLPVAGTRVLLHEVATAVRGPIDSTITDARGRFRFRIRPDSGALYLVSARHDGIEYFSRPMSAAASRADSTLAIVVADSSSAAPVSVAARHIVITRPGGDGARSVLDLTVIRNAGDRTRVAPDTIRPSWSAALPAGTEALDVGEGDFSPGAVTRRRDSVVVFAPIAPGEKQLTVEYRLPLVRHTIGFAFTAPVRTFNLLIEEPDARVSGFRGSKVDTQTVEGRTFRRWTGAAMAGDTVRVEFTRAGQSERWILLALVGAIAVALAVAARRYRVLSIVAVVVVALGCRPPAKPAGAIHLVDDAGDTTALAAPARRVVSLIPAATELLFAIGAGDAVVGRTTWCDYPAAAAAVASVGDGINPNVEAVLARHPDLVIFYRSAQQAATVAKLRSLGIPAVQLSTDALADVGRVARVLGRLTGHGRDADSVATAFEHALDAVTADATTSPPAATSRRRPKVLLLVWEQPPMTVGTGSFLSELITRAGGDNLFADISASSATVSIESIAARDPDLVLLTSEGPTAFASQPAWRVVRAIREHRFIRVRGSEFSHPGPRSPAAIAELTRQLRAVRP